LSRRIAAGPRTGRDLSIDAVEVYEDAVKVFWSDHRTIQRDRSVARRFILEDDLGTRYWVRGGSYSSGPNITGETGVVICSPPVPASARRLILCEDGVPAPAVIELI
jgi:hypothetical protein